MPVSKAICIKSMGKFFISLGIVYIAYVLIGSLVGLPLITDYLPLELFIDIPNGATSYKVELSDIPKALWVYDLSFGFTLILLGYFFQKIKSFNNEKRQK